MRNVIIAGVLGGLLGGAVVGGIFGLFGRGSAASAATPDASAKAIPEALMNKLKGGDVDSFASASRGYMYTIPDTEFAVFKANLSEFREQCTKSYGKPLGEFELVREQAAGTNAARLIYLEKFEKGGVAWYFQMYHSPDGWKLASVH